MLHPFFYWGGRGLKERDSIRSIKGIGEKTQALFGKLGIETIGDLLRYYPCLLYTSFWKNMPKDGHVTIFDRTWYGRVMVERIEGFCTKEEWQRAYREINDMEAHLAHSGAIVLKFWMQIDKDEQERRFKERMENPQKQWKITDEDWRNREKWDLYEEAVNEMIIRTSTSYAPWMIVEGNNKYYARVKVLETVVKAMEERLK